MYNKPSGNSGHHHQKSTPSGASNGIPIDVHGTDDINQMLTYLINSPDLCATCAETVVMLGEASAKNQNTCINAKQISALCCVATFGLAILRESIMTMGRGEPSQQHPRSGEGDG